MTDTVQFEIEQEIAACERRIAVLESCNLNHLTYYHKGELKLLKMKLASIISENKNNEI